MIFRRNLTNNKLLEWNSIKKYCDKLKLSEDRDELIWGPTKNGVFSVKSFYTAMKMQETSSMVGGRGGGADPLT